MNYINKMPCKEIQCAFARSLMDIFGTDMAFISYVDELLADHLSGNYKYIKVSC